MGSYSSDSSVEEISADDFRRMDDTASSRSRVRKGTMGNTAISGSIGQDLSFFASAQAVENKPLELDLKPADEKDDMVYEVVDDDDDNSEKGEGELEEGEIELGLESVKTNVNANVVKAGTDSEPEKKENEEEEEALRTLPPGAMRRAMRRRMRMRIRKRMKRMERRRMKENEDHDELGLESVKTNVNANVVKVGTDLELDKKENEEEEEEEDAVIGEFDQRVGLVLEELETVTVEETMSAFETVCSRLLKSFATLKHMFSENSSAPVLDALIQQAFTGIQTVYGVYSSGNLTKLAQNRDLFLRLLVHIKNQYSVILTAEQVKKIDEIVKSLASEGVKVDKPENVRNLSGMAGLEYRAVNKVCNNLRTALPKLEQPTISRKVDFSPLLNLNADYDEDSLPSPTRDNAPPLPRLKPIGFGVGVIAPPTQPIPPKAMEAGNGTGHPYVDPFKEHSSYQQKYERHAIPASSQLPSPTPSGDGNEGHDDSQGEVCSSTVSNNVRTPGFSTTGANTNGSRCQFVPVKPVGQIGLRPNPVIKAPAKSRDPRLKKFMNTEVGGGLQNGHGSVNSRKNKAGDEPLLDGNTLKRQRNGPSVSLQMATSTDGRDGGPLASQMGNRVRPNASVAMEMGNIVRPNEKVAMEMVNRARPNANVAVERGNRARPNVNVATEMGNRARANANVAMEINKPGNDVNANMKPSGSNGGSMPNPAARSDPAVSLPSLLRDIAVNPTMLLQLVKKEQQRLAIEAQQKTVDPKLAADTQPKSSNLAVNGLPCPAPEANQVSKKPLEIAQKQVLKPQMPHLSTSMNAQNNVGRIHMKRRDPRRILHTNVVQRSESFLGTEPPTTSKAPVSDMQNSKDHATVHKQEEQARTTGLLSQSTPLPDSTRQITKNLKHVADIVPTSESTVAHPAGSQNISPPISSKLVSDSSEPAVVVSGISSQGGSAVGSSVNPWGDVDHLLDGYDDQQKAAIQKERARRIVEQNKMFSERKLCLVLDLDHTLLNSAKFIEVDPIHEEILMKKEEQDRGKPKRHLFRFQHMGMWTKLRPGIWTFLEKASKLFELHLYTMGNKLYATEMAKVLDPTGALFAGRVISKGDDGDPCDGDERVPKSKDLEGVLGMESAVVIIDDSVRVWPHHKLNLIVVERYTYFPCSRRQFGLPGPSLLEIDHDERPEDGTLASSLGVIERIHHNFFSHRSLNEVDVRNILASEQRKILGGCKIVFSRIFPVGEANPHLHPLWQTAERFGAECTNQIDEQVTHVVANSPGTDKVNWALSTGRFVVHPGWVEASALLYRRASEQDFAVKL